MDDQKDVDSINNRLYNLEVPNEPIKKIMFYFTVLHDVIDYRFPENYLNFNNPYFKTYNEMEKFLALANALNPEILHNNNAIIYYSKKEFYKYYQVTDDDNGNPYEFKVIDPKDAADPKFHKNYENNFNIPNINYHEREFDIGIPNKVEFPDSEDTDTVEDYYYEEGLEDNYQIKPNEHYEYVDDDKKKQYLNYRKKYNEKIVKKKKRTTLASTFYPNQADENPNGNQEEEDLDSNDDTRVDLEKVNIINKLVVTKDWVNYIYTQPVKQLMKNLKTAVKEEDVIRVKTISLPKNIFFYLSIFLLLLILACSIALITICAKLNFNKKFKDLDKGHDHSKKAILLDKIDYSNDTVIVPDKSAYHRVRNGNNLGITSGCFGIFFVFFIFILWIILSIGQTTRSRKYRNSRRGKKKEPKKYGLNMVHILVFALLTLISFIISLIAEIFIIIGIAKDTYVFVHHSSRDQLICNSLILVSYILVIIFYFKQ